MATPNNNGTNEEKSPTVGYGELLDVQLHLASAEDHTEKAAANIKQAKGIMAKIMGKVGKAKGTNLNNQ